MKKTAVLALITIGILIPVTQADILEWMKKDGARILKQLKPSEKKSDKVIYKWIDEKGVRHFSNIKPPDVSAAESVSAQKYTVPGIILPEKADRSLAAPPSRKVTKNTQKAGRKKKKSANSTNNIRDKVVIFTAGGCIYCRQALSFLRSHNIVFKEYNIDKDRAAKKKMRAAGGVQHVPFAVINGRKIFGFSEGRYRRALDLPESGNPPSGSRIRSTGRT